MVAGWLRERLWHANNWCAELVAIGRERSRSTERTFDLAVATEYCDPDRSAALALYVEAARGGHEQARERARAIATTLGSHLVRAELEQAAGDLVAAGTAYLDGGFPELALAPLQAFVSAKPPNATTATEYARLERVSILLAFARKAKADAENEVARSVATATVSAFVHAERIARLAGLTESRDAAINAARAAAPDDSQVAHLVTSRLFERGAVEELLSYHRGRFERAPSRTEHVERMRALGVELVARNVQPGLGLRLLRMALETAYAALLPDIKSHLAAWQLIWLHARQQRTTSDLVPLIVQAFNSPLPESDAVFLARLGLEIAWRDVGDQLAAQPYAAILLDFVGDHPYAVAYVEEVVPAEAPLPPEPSITFSKPAPKARIVDEAPVKRSGPTSSPIKTTSRLDLLRPRPRTSKPTTVPPPRAAALQRDTSPFPVAKPPASPTIRAERKVVPVDVTIELPNGSSFLSVLRDFSTSGAFIMTKRAIDPAATITLELKIPESGKLTLATLRVTARVVRSTELGWGVAYVDPSPELVAALAAIVV